MQLVGFAIGQPKPSLTLDHSDDTVDEPQAKQAGTEQYQGPRFRNRVATRVHTPQTRWRELQGKHQIIEVVIGPWPR